MIDHANKIISHINEKYVLPFQMLECIELSGGTSSNVWLVLGDNDEMYVLKSNEEIKDEIHYLKVYENLAILPKLVYVDEKDGYFLYTYIPGKIEAHMNNKKTMLKKLVSELIKHYKPVDNHQWGWIWDSHDDWNQFLITEINNAKELNSTVLNEEDFDLVTKLCLKETRRSGYNLPYLLHGDCGVHNFLQHDHQLVAVIDPLPLAGPPLYELVFAFCSSPEQLTFDVIYDAASELPHFDCERKQLIEEVLIGLYMRFLRCIYHHPHDLPTYIKAWEYWKEIYHECGTANGG